MSQAHDHRSCVGGGQCVLLRAEFMRVKDKVLRCKGSKTFKSLGNRLIAMDLFAKVWEIGV